MNDDMYLNLAVELYEKGSWDKDTFVRRVILYANEKNMDSSVVEAFIKRVTKEPEYTIDQKRQVLSKITLDGTELKYGDIVYSMDDETIERFYKVEEQKLGKGRIKDYLNNGKDSVNPNEVIEQRKQVVKVVKKVVPSKPVEYNGESIVEDSYGDVVEEEKNVEMNNNFVVPEPLLDIKVGGMMQTAEETNLKDKVSPTEIKEQRRQVVKVVKKVVPSKTVEYNSEPTVENSYLDNAEEKKEVEMNNNFVIPSSLFDINENDMPQTEEEFSQHAEKITEKEKDSVVKKLEISPERLEKLKKSKDKTVNFFLKTAMVVTAVWFLHPITSVALIGGYCHFASEIKNGTYNPTNAVGKAIKHAVEKVMYIGMSNEKEKGGRTK